MSKPKHTPGPWFVFGNGHCVGAPLVDATAPVQQNTAGVAMCGMARRPPHEREANAKLVASAPAMSLALELIACGLARLERHGSLCEFCFDGMRYVCTGTWNDVLDCIGWDKARSAVEKARGLRD